MRHPLAVSTMLVLLAATGCDKEEPDRRWYYTCGDPVCVGYTVKEGVPLCTGQAVSNRCEAEGLTCDPKDDCNRLLVCAAEPPPLAACPDLP